MILGICIRLKKYLSHIKFRIINHPKLWRLKGRCLLAILKSSKEGDSCFFLGADILWMLTLTKGLDLKDRDICSSSPPEIKYSQDKRRQQNAFILSNDTLTGVQLLNCCVCTNLAYWVILASTSGNVLSSSMYSISFSSQHVLVQSLCSKKQNKSISTAWLGSLIYYTDG